jgi:lactoylglutathione lyase
MSGSNPAFRFDHVHIISETPHESAQWYVDTFGAVIAADTMARGAPQIFVELGGANIIIRGKRPGEAPTKTNPIGEYADYASHNEWGTDHFGFLYEGDLKAYCAELAAKGVQFPVPLKEGVNGMRLCYVSAPDGVSIEIMQT